MYTEQNNKKIRLVVLHNIVRDMNVKQVGFSNS